MRLARFIMKMAHCSGRAEKKALKITSSQPCTTPRYPERYRPATMKGTAAIARGKFGKAASFASALIPKKRPAASPFFSKSVRVQRVKRCRTTSTTSQPAEQRHTPVAWAGFSKNSGSRCTRPSRSIHASVLSPSASNSLPAKHAVLVIDPRPARADGPNLQPQRVAKLLGRWYLHADLVHDEQNAIALQMCVVVAERQQLLDSGQLEVHESSSHDAQNLVRRSRSSERGSRFRVREALFDRAMNAKRPSDQRPSSRPQSTRPS